MINKFENLEAWKSAKELAIMAYEITDQYPKNEIFALTSQTTRAAVSIPANISEGCSRSSSKDMVRFLEIAIGSAFELKTLIDIAYARKYFDNSAKEKLDNLLSKCLKLAYGLKRSKGE